MARKRHLNGFVLRKGKQSRKKPPVPRAPSGREPLIRTRRSNYLYLASPGGSD